MPLMLKYVLETGAIVGVWDSTNVAMLEAQRVPDDPVYGYLLSTQPLAASTLEQDYQVIDGVLVPRAETAQEG